MRCSWLALALCLGGCARQQAPVYRRVAILPIENLAADAGMAADAAAVRLAIWESLQGQPAVAATMAGHRRDLPELPGAYVVDGYVAAGRFRLRLNDEPVVCAGSLGDCVARLAGEIAGRMGVTPRPLPKPETLRRLARANMPGEAAESLESAASAEPLFASVWLGWAGQEQARGGVGAAVAALGRAPLASLPPYDAARVRVRMAELRQDRKAHAKAMGELARLSPADMDLQEQAAREATAARDLRAAAEIYDRVLAISRQPRYYNQGAYLAAFQGDRAKAERYANAAQEGAPNDPQFADTRGEIAFYFGDYAAAARYFEQAAGSNATFLGGLDLWKAADAARMAGDKPRAEALLKRYLDFRLQAGARNTLSIQAVWDWRADRAEAAFEKLQAAAKSTERGKALFLRALMSLHGRDFAGAETVRREMEPNALENAFLRSIMDGTVPPPGFPIPPEAIAAVHRYLRGDANGALTALAVAREKMDPLSEGYWRKLDALLRNRKPEGLLPASPDDWLAVLLR